MFIGQYTHTIDDKNRLSLPVKFRKKMGTRVIVTPGLDGCLFVFTLKQWGGIAELLAGGGEGGSARAMFHADNRGFNRYMLGGAVEAEVDALGRILVPDFLRDQAQLKKEVVLIGVQNRVEIWNEKSWTGYKARVEKEADRLAEKLGQVGAL